MLGPGGMQATSPNLWQLDKIVTVDVTVQLVVKVKSAYRKVGPGKAPEPLSRRPLTYWM
jgi:hypothetical protein